MFELDSEAIPIRVLADRYLDYINNVSCYSDGKQVIMSTVCLILVDIISMKNYWKMPKHAPLQSKIYELKQICLFPLCNLRYLLKKAHGESWQCNKKTIIIFG